jgi:DNA-directed RNA polymerase subunit RPC12/RpoP
MAADSGQAIVECMHCHTPITDLTTRVTNGSYTYCCVNCSAAMEQTGPGSDPDSATGKNHLRCTHCGVPILNEDNMQGSGDQIFCCPNCAAHARQGQRHSAARR